jgi:hypothetical protein
MIANSLITAAASAFATRACSPPHSPVPKTLPPTAIRTPSRDERRAGTGGLVPNEEPDVRPVTWPLRPCDHSPAQRLSSPVASAMTLAGLSPRR